MSDGFSLNEQALAIVAEPLTTSKGTLQRYRHAIQDTVNHRLLLPDSPQARIKSLLKGRAGLSFGVQKGNFETVIEVAKDARARNKKAQSCSAIAAKALEVIVAREKEKAARFAAPPAPAGVASWDDDDPDDELEDDYEDAQSW